MCYKAVNIRKHEYRECQTVDNGTSVIEATQSKQQSIKDAFQGMTPLPHSSQLWKKLTVISLQKMAQPLNTINDKGFRHLLTSFEPRYGPPDRKAITNDYLTDLYVQQKERVSEEMAQTSYFAVTTDGWTSCAN